MIGYLTSNHALISAFGLRTAKRTRRESLALNRVFKSAPKLADYVNEHEIIGSKGPLDRPISGLSSDSRRVAPGNLFFALPGRRVDGAAFIDEAMSRGAVAIVTQQKLPVIPPARVTFIQVADARAALAAVAQRYYKFPDRDMTVVGVTGASGKTTVSHLVKYFLGGDQRVGLIGTISYDLGVRVVPAYRTTPEALEIFGLMAQMRDAGCRHAIVEVSSPGLEQRRVHGLNFGAAVFTSITRNDLEGRSAGLFAGNHGARTKVAVVNFDDPQGAAFAAKIPTGIKVVSFGENPHALVRAENITFSDRRTTLRLVWPGGTMDLESPLVGRYHVSNLLAAIATAWGLGRDPLVFLARLRSFQGVAGRMERIDAGQPFNVFVDYAHTDTSLRQSLRALRPITPGKLHVVFGCGGNRDRDKRSLMTRAALELADRACATADNPRSERILQIFADMRAGVTTPDKLAWIEDRRRAIALAIEACQPGDSLLIAGKGHETYQEFADTVIPFDDRQVVRELLQLRERPA